MKFVGPGLAPATGVSTFVLDFSCCVDLGPADLREGGALSPLGERVARRRRFLQPGGPGLRPPKGYWRLGRTGRYGPQAGEGVASPVP